MSHVRANGVTRYGLHSCKYPISSDPLPTPPRTKIHRTATSTTSTGGSAATSERSSALIALLEEQKQATIHRAVTRGLDPDVRLKPSGVEWLGDVPEHWDVARLAETAALVNGFPFDSELFDPSNGIPLVRIRDLFKEKTAVRWTGGSIPEASIADRDVLIGMDGDFNVAWWDRGPALLNQRLCCVRALPSRASQRYLFYCLRVPAHGVERSHLRNDRETPFLVGCP